jgi:glutamate-1-semialdehyde 2,1-aminomutase
LYREAQQVFPSGVTHDNRYFQPFPVAVARAEGAYKWDVDGYRYIDYGVGHGALLLGHGHKAIVAAVTQQLERGTHYAASHELELRWAQLVQRLIPSAERVKFVNSGTEATHMAIRLARAFTGRTKVLKFAGHFHGWHDAVTIGVDQPYDVPTSVGVPEETLRTVEVCRQGDEVAVAQALDRREIAAVILEPTGGSWGTLPLDPSFLHTLRRQTRATETLLIFDEVITGFRCSPGGAQAAFGVTPDITTLAKILAGGLPGGAVGGRSDVMELLSFRDEPGWNRRKRVAHPGTFNGNPLSAAAGVAALGIVETGAPHAYVHALGTRLRASLNGVAKEFDLAGCVYGDFSMFHILPARARLHSGPHGGLEPGKIKDAKPGLDSRLRMAMLTQGVDMSGGGMLTTAHSDTDLDQTADAFRWSLRQLEREGWLA